MRFLINMNLPRDLGKLLGATGHECRHVADIGMAAAEDVDILHTAGQAGETILTHDLDYGELLAFSRLGRPSVVIFRIRDVRPENLTARLTATWARIAEPLETGAIVTLRDSTVRIRRLPIESG